MALPIPVIQVSIGGSLAPEFMKHLIKECNVNALGSTPTALVYLANWCLSAEKTCPEIRLVLFAGEPLFSDQKSLLQSVFRNAKFTSFRYASTDSGIVGKPVDLTDPRVYQVSPGIIAEVCTDIEKGEFRQENGVEGSLVITNLLRRLMPVVRYPTGDRVEWVGYKAGIFRLLARDSHSLCLGPVSIDVQDIRKIVPAALSGIKIVALQAAILRQGANDLLQFRIDAEPTDEKATELLIRARLYEERPMLAEHVLLGYIAEPVVRFMSISEMKVNDAMGKLPQGVDLRGSS